MSMIEITNSLQRAKWAIFNVPAGRAYIGIDPVSGLEWVCTQTPDGTRLAAPVEGIEGSCFIASMMFNSLDTLFADRLLFGTAANAN